MAQPNHLVHLNLPELVLLLSYYWTSVNSSIGDLGTVDYNETLNQIDQQSNIKISASQLENLVYHMKQVIFEKLRMAKPDPKIKNYNRIMLRLKAQAPSLFKELPSGEVVFVNFQDRD